MEFSYQPKAQNRNHLYLIGGLFACCFATLIIGSFIPKGGSVVQLISILSLCLALMFWLRYAFTSFTYTVTDAYGDLSLIVTEQQGKRLSTAARIHLCDVSELLRVQDRASDEGVFAQRRYRDRRRRYSYLATFSPSAFLVLFGSEEGEEYAVRMEADEAFISSLQTAIETAKAQKAMLNPEECEEG